MTASTAGTGLYFFLSYPHRYRGDARKQREPDLWVGGFFRDLCRSVEQQVGQLRGASPGFMDVDRRVGEDWPSRLVRALEICRVFVPLYSRSYFDDECCGVEWNYFARRALDSGAPDAAIVPAIWDPVGLEKLPQAVRAPQLRHRGGQAYGDLGFYGIMKPSRYREEYANAITDLAARIVTAAERRLVKEGLKFDHATLDSAFHRAETDVGSSGGKRVRITVVAPRQDELPAERENSSWYGPSALDWKPYAPESCRPIAEVAAELARSLGYLPEVGDLRQHEEGLLSGDPRTGPEILIIDPWALLLPHSQHLLQRLNMRDQPWVKAVVPWSAADAESQRSGEKLRAEIEAVFLHKLTEVTSTSSKAAEGVPSLAEFDEVLCQLIGVAAKRYLGHVPARPPGGKAVERPRVS